MASRSLLFLTSGPLLVGCDRVADRNAPHCLLNADAVEAIVNCLPFITDPLMVVVVDNTSHEPPGLSSPYAAPPKPSSTASPSSLTPS